jgi:hypothetical protein
MVGDGVQVIPEKTKSLPRRDFIKVTAAMAGGAVGGMGVVS